MAPDGAGISTVSNNTNFRVPEMREAFPGCSIDYEIVVCSHDLWDAVTFCSNAFRQCGFELQFIRCAKQGPVTLRVRDDGNADLDRLDTLFGASDTHRIDAWTTVIGRKKASA